MQIREQGKKIQLIRTHYNKEKKRTEGKVFDSFEKHLSTIPEGIRNQLNNEEVGQLESYLSERSRNDAVDTLKGSLSIASLVLKRSVEALAIDEALEDFTQAKANEIYANMEALKKALKKAGFKQAAKSAPVIASENTEKQATWIADDEKDTASINTK